MTVLNTYNAQNLKKNRNFLIPKKPTPFFNLEPAINFSAEIHKVVIPAKVSKLNIKEETETRFSTNFLPAEVRIRIPENILVEIIKNPNSGSTLTNREMQIIIKGVRGTLSCAFGFGFTCWKENDYLVLNSHLVKNQSAQLANYQKILYNMFIGVTKGYKTKLKTSGVGYKGVIERERLLALYLGYSHPALQWVPESIKIRFNRKNNRIHLMGTSLPLVTTLAANIYDLKRPDVYNGKGIRYRAVPLRHKEGKKQKR